MANRYWSVALEEVSVDGSDPRPMWTLERGSHANPGDEEGESSFIVQGDREILAVGVVTCSRKLSAACGAYSPIRVARLVPNDRAQLYHNVRQGRQFDVTVVGETTTEGILLGSLGERDLEVEVSHDGPQAFDVREGHFLLSRGDTLRLDIVFAPQDTGHFTGTVTIRTNDLQDSIIVAPLEGTALAEPPAPVYWWTPFLDETPREYPFLAASDPLRRGDFDGDCRVGLEDFFLLAEQYGRACGEEHWASGFDLTDDCAIDMEDVAAFSDACHRSSETPSRSTLQGAPEVIQIGEASYALQPFVWRDFMPIAPAGGSSMIAVLRIAELGTGQVTEGIEARCAWFINGSQVWGTGLGDETRLPTQTREFKRVARNGPKWETGTEIDVVVALEDSSGTLHLVRRGQQRIVR